MLQFIFKVVGFFISLFFSLLIISFVLVFGVFFLIYWLLSGRKKISPFGNVKVFRFGQGWQQNGQQTEGESGGPRRAQNASWQYQEAEIRDIDAEVIDVTPIEISHEKK